MKELKIYHFFSCGELIETIDARCVEDAVTVFRRWKYTKQDCTYILEYNRKTGRYKRIKLEGLWGDIVEPN